jgi:competence protein ComEA
MLRYITAIIVALSAFAAQAAVDVNKASQADLEALPGVGPSLSGKIMAARQTGEFRNWNDLVDRVSGIGPGSAVRLSKAGLTVAGETYAGPPAKAANGEKPARKAKEKETSSKQ